ncbi:MAG: thiamine biosynthesis protein ThiJ [bacterium]|nr:thiamine biosynthesis protein ThiJ [bacterium]
MARVLVPLPDLDFDVTEVAVPWRLLTEAGHEVVFATEEGRAAEADPLLLTGVLFGQLGAEPEARAFYREMETGSGFRNPLRWKDLAMQEFDALLLPGGHAPGMRQFLASELLQERVASFCGLARPIGAICHGVLVLARTRDPATGRSVLASHRTTCLPRYMEALAYALTFWKLGRYYRTYPAYVEAEVRAALDDADAQFERGPITIGTRGTNEDDSPAFVVEDDLYVSARWPGDAYLFTKRLMKRLEPG